ncbi:hypothetical protein [Streptomyces sp. NPDC056632]|uniref:hypothetical protein n=1 Tax=Streptomyces sp. NPDC056632 TaxID=3345884 RepID=UPI003698AC9A
MDTDGCSRREVVTGRPHASRRSVAAAKAPRTPHDVPAADRVLLQALMRRQLRTALTALGALVALIGLLPLVFRVFPDPADWPPGPLVVWGVLGVGAYPGLVLISRWYVIRAERNEQDALKLVEGV